MRSRHLDRIRTLPMGEFRHSASDEFRLNRFRQLATAELPTRSRQSPCRARRSRPSPRLNYAPLSGLSARQQEPLPERAVPDFRARGRKMSIYRSFTFRFLDDIIPKKQTSNDYTMAWRFPNFTLGCRTFATLCAVLEKLRRLMFSLPLHGFALFNHNQETLFCSDYSGLRPIYAAQPHPKTLQPAHV